MQAYNHIQNQWLGIDILEKNIINHFSTTLTIGEKPIALLILQEGISAYSDLLHNMDSKHYPHELMNAFIVGCLKAIQEYSKFCIVHDNTDEHWSYKSEVDFIRWSHNKSTLMIENSNSADNPLDMHLVYFRHIPKNIKLAMRRFGHEQTIMGNYMAHSL